MSISAKKLYGLSLRCSLATDTNFLNMADTLAAVSYEINMMLVSDEAVELAVAMFNAAQAYEKTLAQYDAESQEKLLAQTRRIRKFAGEIIDVGNDA